MDKKAKNILFKTYWTSAGWKNKEDRLTNTEDFEYAKTKGLMFDPIHLSHKKLMEECEKLLTENLLKKAVAAFLSSLSNKRIDHRSAISSYANLTNLLKEGDEYFYDVDEDDDINILNFERIKWGGVRHGQALYNYLDLKILQTELIDEPTISDIEIFKNILLTISNSNPTDIASNLGEKIKLVWNASKNDCATLLEILGCCGIMETLNYDRKEPSKHDWNFVAFWQGQDKYNVEKVNYYFKKYNLSK